MIARFRLPALVLATLLLAAPLANATTTRGHLAHARNGPVKRGCVDADTPARYVSKQAMRAAVVCLINRQRSAHGLPALHADNLLDRSAQLWTDAMVTTGLFTHGSNFASRLTAAGFIWSFAGENIATGFQTPRQVVTAWMASTDHCQNILDPSYANVGTGVSTRPVGRFASGPATWTQDFGLWMGHRPPSGNHGPANGCPYNG